MISQKQTELVYNENLCSVLYNLKANTHMYTAVAVQRSEGLVCGDLDLNLVNVTRLWLKAAVTGQDVPA